MKVLIVRLVTAGCLTFLMVFCTIYAMGKFAHHRGSAPSQPPTPSLNQPLPTEAISLVSTDATESAASVDAVAAQEVPQRRKSQQRVKPDSKIDGPDDRWMLGTESQRSRFLRLMQAAKPPALHVDQWANSKPLTLQKQVGKIVVLNFWSTWSEPCLKSTDLNNRIYLKYRDQDVVMIGICNADGSQDMADVVKSKAIVYPVAIDTPDDKTLTDYQVQALPTYFLIGRDGRLRFADVDHHHLGDAIEFLMNEI